MNNYFFSTFYYALVPWNEAKDIAMETLFALPAQKKKHINIASIIKIVFFFVEKDKKEWYVC